MLVLLASISSNLQAMALHAFRSRYMLDVLYPLYRLNMSMVKPLA